MKQNNKPIDLLILDSSANSAETYTSTIRNAHLVVHPEVISDQGELLDYLEASKPDLILFAAAEGSFDFESTVNICLKSLEGVPLIVINKDMPADMLLASMRGGVRDIVAHDDTEHLQLVVTREVGDLQVQQALTQAQAMLKEAEDRCTSLIESSMDAIAYIHEGMHMYANPIYLEMFGYVDMDDIEGLPILDMISKDSLGQFKQFLKNLGNESCELELKCQNSNGQPFDAMLEFSPAAYDSEPCTQIIIRNFSSAKVLEESIAQLSELDSHTGLPNRQNFISELDERLESCSASSDSYSLLYLSIDGFQEIRSDKGLASSDTLLKVVAEVLTNDVGEQEFLARFGDHTFIIASNKDSSLEVEALAEQLRLAVENHPFDIDGEAVNLTTSVGIALLDKEVKDGQDFINNAYEACDKARASGGNQISLFDAGEMSPSYGETTSGDETRINELIQHALANDRFKLAFQPIVSLQGDSRENYAILTRLLDHNDEEILPEHFMSHAEKANQMADIDRWVIKSAINEVVAQRNQGRKVNFFINLSAAALQDEGLLLHVCDCLRSAQAKGAWLTFQIKEDDIRAHINAAKQLIEGLTKIKCLLAIDQFGMHKNTDSLLKHFPVEFVKFDLELMDDLATKQDKQDTLNELNSLALSHNAKTVAMGVEDANSLAVLWTVGVNYIQGYFLQEPSENIAYEFGAG